MRLSCSTRPMASTEMKRSLRQPLAPNPTYEQVLRVHDARQRDLARRPLWPAEFKHMAPHPLWMIGYHEAGHAVAATALNYEVRFVEVRGLYLSSGRMQPAPEAYLQGPIADRIAIKLAGGEA